MKKVRRSDASFHHYLGNRSCCSRYHWDNRWWFDRLPLDFRIRNCIRKSLDRCRSDLPKWSRCTRRWNRCSRKLDTDIECSVLLDKHLNEDGRRGWICESRRGRTNIRRRATVTKNPNWDIGQSTMFDHRAGDSRLHTYIPNNFQPRRKKRKKSSFASEEKFLGESRSLGLIYAFEPLMFSMHTTAE